MSPPSMFAIFMILASFFTLSVTAHRIPCSETFKMINREKHFMHCKKLSTLEAEIAWNITSEQQIEIIFGRSLYAGVGWLAWGVNPGKMPQMVGTRAMIGIRYSDGRTFSGTYNITRDTKMGCKLEPKIFNETAQNEVKFQDMSVEYIEESDYFVIQARVILPSPEYDITKLNHVWQFGYEAEGKEPKQHPTILQNVDSTEIINLRTGLGIHAGRHRDSMRTLHGILNIVGWGTLFPLGVIVARYFKYPLQSFEQYRFRLHITCQIAGYLLGTSGWILGLYLGNLSKLYLFTTHRLYAIFIFAFTTLQMLALLLKPDQRDEYRKYWNMYHHFLGYALLAVISINIFNGIDILKPNMTWRRAYIGILIAFAGVVTVLEIYTWTKFKINQTKSAIAKDGTAQHRTDDTDLVIPQPRP